MTRKKKVEEEKNVIAYKGFEHDWTCRGFKYEVGKEYTMDGDIEVSSKGFHACPMPLDVFSYYSPVDNNGRIRRFAQVEQSGVIKSDNDKNASSKIKIKAALNILDLAKFQIEWVKDNATNKEESNHSSGYRSVASSSGGRSVASSSGYRSVASSSGDQSVASSSGDLNVASSSGYQSVASSSGDLSVASSSGYQSVASSSGYRSVASSSGDLSVASVEKENSAAFAFGYKARAKAKNGWIVIVDWREDENYNIYIENIYSAKIGGKIKNKTIKSDVWYWFEDGKLKSEKDVG